MASPSSFSGTRPVLPSAAFKPAAPTLAAISPSSATPGSALTATFSGTNFRQFDTFVAIDGGGVVVNSLSVKSPTEIAADITVAVTATAGPRHIRLTTSGGTTEAQVFVVASP